jgi:hypothetical protein
MSFSADEAACDVGADMGSPASPDYGPTGNAFTGEIAWVQIDIGGDSHDHLIKAEDRINIAMARQSPQRPGIRGRSRRLLSGSSATVSVTNPFAVAAVQEAAEPIQDQRGSLFGDPVTDTVDHLYTRVSDALGVAAQQRRGDHRMGRAVEPARRDINTSVGEFTTQPTDHLATQKCSSTPIAR